MDFKGKLNKAYRKYWNAHDRAKNALDEITLLIQTQYPNLEASVTSEESKKKNSVSHKERFQKLEQRKKLSDAHKGKKLSEEHKRHISESLRRKYNEL